MTRMSQNPVSGIIATITGGTITVEQIVNNGSLWLTFGGALLAFVGGVWAWRTAKIQREAALLDLATKRLEHERAQHEGR